MANNSHQNPGLQIETGVSTGLCPKGSSPRSRKSEGVRTSTVVVSVKETTRLPISPSHSQQTPHFSNSHRTLSTTLPIKNLSGEGYYQTASMYGILLGPPYT